MKCVYFVAFMTDRGHIGNAEVPVNNQIVSIDGVRVMARAVGEALMIGGNVTITNFQLLRTEEG